VKFILKQTLIYFKENFHFSKIFFEAIKLFAWELRFSDEINKIRKREISLLKKMGYCNIWLKFNTGAVSFLVKKKLV
jgi:hypothetical protein